MVSNGLMVLYCCEWILLLYMYRYTNVLLRRVSQGGVCYSQSRKAFVSRKAMQFKAEEYSDVHGQCYYNVLNCIKII